jgi:hypothetical protein
VAQTEGVNRLNGGMGQAMKKAAGSLAALRGIEGLFGLAHLFLISWLV